jgi:hypothetical protein
MENSMHPRVMKVSWAVCLTVACSLICGVLGVAGAAEYVMRGMDKIDQSAAASAMDSAQRALTAPHPQSATQREIRLRLANNLKACQENFATGTLLYETAPQLNIAITGLRGLPLIPVGMQGTAPAPRWWIPAKIEPQTYGDPRGAVYYYTKRDPSFTDGRLLTEGPYVPVPVATQ